MAPEQTPQVEIEVDQSLAFRFGSDPGLTRKIGASLVALGLAQTGITLAGIDYFDSSKSSSTMAESTVRGELLGPPFDNPKAYRPTIHHARVKEAPEPVPSSISPAMIVPPPHKTVVVKPAKPHKAVSHGVPLRPAITARPALRVESQQLIDISWPDNNCQATIPSDIHYGIVGVNHGKPFRANDCLKHEASEFEDFALYVNTANPSAESPHDYGYNAGKFAVKYAFQQGVYRPMWWLDVETANSWSKDVHANIQSILGTMAGIRDTAQKLNLAEPKFGIYSAITTCKNPDGSTYLCGMYPTITGNWRATWNNKALPGWQAARTCKTGIDFTGGGLALGQGQENGLDTSDLCSDFTLQDVL